jgi:hypothetical protein
MNTLITFEDHGQDFLTWELDENKKVVDCQPFQASTWCKSQVVNEQLAVGEYVIIETKHTASGYLTIKYPIEKIETDIQGPKHRFNRRAATAILLIALFFGKAQNCRDNPPQVNISTSCHSVCAPGTYKLDTSFCGWFVMHATGAQAYSWNVQGTLTVVSPTILYTPGLVGITNYTLTGSVTYPNGLTCTNTAVISITAVACAHSDTPVGINEIPPVQLKPVYTDLLGNQIEPRNNEIMIERVGTRRRKVLIQR